MLYRYKRLVRWHMQSCFQSWSPHNRKYVDALEGVQKMFARVVLGLEDFSYGVRSDRLGLFHPLVKYAEG